MYYTIYWAGFYSGSRFYWAEIKSGRVDLLLLIVRFCDCDFFPLIMKAPNIIRLPSSGSPSYSRKIKKSEKKVSEEIVGGVSIMIFGPISDECSSYRHMSHQFKIP